MADLGEQERKEKIRKIDLGSSKDQGSPTVLESPEHIPSSPPSDLNTETFKCEFPLINIRSMRQIVGKFADSTFMESGVLYSFIEYIFLSIEENKGMCYEAEMADEMAVTPLHLIFLTSLGKLSRAFWIYNQKKKVKNQELGKEIKDDQNGAETEELEDEISPIHLVLTDIVNPRAFTDQDSPSSESWAEDVIFNNEVKIVKGIPDIIVKRFCENFLRENQLDPRKKETVREAFFERKLRTISIIELKDDSVFPDGFQHALYQCASRAVREATENMAMHKDRVIYLLVCSDQRWGFGTLKITGMEKGDRDEQELPVGEMFICHRIFQRSFSYKRFTEDDCLLIQSLLRLMLGDKVLQINTDDAREVIQICEEEKTKILNSIRDSTIQSQLKTWKRQILNKALNEA